MFRLVIGEFYKFIKGASFKITCLALLLSSLISLFTYKPESDIMKTINEFLGGYYDSDIFTVIDGLDNQLVKMAAELGYEIPEEYIDVFNQKFDDSFKVKMLTLSPNEYYKSLNPVSSLDGHAFLDLSNEFKEFANYDSKFYLLILDASYDDLDKVLEQLQAFYQNNLPIFQTLALTIEQVNQIISQLPNDFDLNSNFYALIEAKEELNEYTHLDFLNELETAIEWFFTDITVEDLPDLSFENVIINCYNQTTLARYYAYDEFLSGLFPDDTLLVYEQIIQTLDASAYEILFGQMEQTAIYGLLKTIFETALQTPYENIAEIAQDILIEHIKVNYFALYDYLLSVPLFNEEMLSKLMGDDVELRDEITANKVKIIYLMANIVANATDYENISDLFIYELTVKPAHVALYGQYEQALFKLRDDIIRMSQITRFWQTRDNDTLNINDFAKQLATEMGQKFEQLVTLANTDVTTINAQDEQSLLNEIEILYDEFIGIFSLLNHLVRIDYGDLSFLYFWQESNDDLGEYRNFRNEYKYHYDLFLTLKNVISAKNTFSYKMATLKTRLNSAIDRRKNGYFGDIRGKEPIKERMQRLFSFIDTALFANVDDEVFDECFGWVYQELYNCYKILLQINKNSNNMINIEKMFFDAEMLQGVQDAYAETLNISYEQLKQLSRSFSRKTGIINDYFQKAYLDLVITKYQLTDKQLNNINGIFGILGYGTTKYTVKSDVTKDLYLLENPDKIGTFTTTQVLDNVYGFMGYSLSITSVFILIAIAITASASIAGEFETGSIKLLLIRPYKRASFLTAKLIMQVLTLFIMFIIMFGLLFGMGAAKYGSEARDVLVIFNATRVSVMHAFSVISLQYLFSFIEFIIYIAIGMMISTVFKSRSGSVAVTVFVYFAKTVLTLLLSTYSWYKYVIFNNTNLFMYMANGPTLFDMNFAFSAIVIAVYLVIIFSTTYVVFKKRDAS